MSRLAEANSPLCKGILNIFQGSIWPTSEGWWAAAGARRGWGAVQTLIIHKLGFNQNYYTFTLILLIKIVMCSKFS